MITTSAMRTASFAGVVSRTLAYLLDALIVAIAGAVFLTGFGLVATVVGADARDLARTVAAAYLVLLPFVFAVYCAVFWALAGRTVGMALAGVRVVGMTGGPVRWWSALLRGLVLAYFPIGSLWLLVDRRHQAVHDKLARTLVVHSS